MGQIKVSGLKVGMNMTNCYIFYDETQKKAVIVDPGDSAQFIEKHIEELGVCPEAILLTHAHYDHIGALSAVKEAYEIPVYVHREDVPMLSDPGLNLGGLVVNLSDNDVIIDGGEILEIAGIKIKVIHTPGHTRGCVCYYLEDDGILFSGDTMFRYSWGRTDFPGGSQKEIMESIHKKLLPLPGETLVLPGHEGATRISDERRVHGYIS